MEETIKGMMQFLTHDQEPDELKDWLRPVSVLASHIVTGPMNIETYAALRRLMECRDCMKRAKQLKPVEE